MKDIIIYTTKYCPSCLKLKNYLIINNVLFCEKNMETSDALTELALNNIFTNIAPILKIDNNFYNYDKLFNKNELNENFILNIIL